jgi:hypothetical protein
MKRRTTHCTLGFVSVLSIAAGVSAHAALVINPTFNDGAMSAAGLSPATIASVHTAFNYAANQIASHYNDSITVNITVTAVSGTATLGQSTTQLVGTTTYGQTRTLLLNDAKTTDDSAANASLPVSPDPAPGGNFWFARAQAKALGLIADDNVNDGTFTFGAGHTYAYDPANRAVTGAFDFIGVAEHEISEIMGRIGLLGTTIGTMPGTPNSFVALDLFRYTAPGVRNLAPTAGDAYFSINSGNTSLRIFNPNGNGGDLADWKSGQGNDSANAFTGTGAQNDFSAVDFQTLDVIGYDYITPVPEPVNYALGVFGGLSVLVGLCRRKQVRA